MRAVYVPLLAAIATLSLFAWSILAVGMYGIPGFCVLSGRSVTFRELEDGAWRGQPSYPCLKNLGGSIGAVQRFRREELVAHFRYKFIWRWSPLIYAAAFVAIYAYGRLWGALWDAGARHAARLHPLKLHASR